MVKTERMTGSIKMYSEIRKNVRHEWDKDLIAKDTCREYKTYSPSRIVDEASVLMLLLRHPDHDGFLCWSLTGTTGPDIFSARPSLYYWLPEKKVKVFLTASLVLGELEFPAPEEGREFFLKFKKAAIPFSNFLFREIRALEKEAKSLAWPGYEEDYQQWSSLRKKAGFDDHFRFFPLWRQEDVSRPKNEEEIGRQWSEWYDGLSARVGKDTLANFCKAQSMVNLEYGWLSLPLE
jgi:hypothetical protein